MIEKFGKDYFYGKKSNYYSYDKLNPSKQFKSVISFIKNQKLKGRFLDVGCAFGLLLKEVSSFFNELHGCDISQFALTKARQKIPKANLKAVNVEEPLSYPDDMFDCITALDVLEHTNSFEKSFANLVRKLKRGGYLILSVPINNCLRKMFGFLDKDKTHVSVLSESKIIRIINTHALKIIRIRHFCPFPIFYRIPYIPAAVELILKKDSSRFSGGTLIRHQFF